MTIGLDANGDRIIDAREITNAPAALRKLDRNRDGKLSPEECGFLMSSSRLNAKLIDRIRTDFMRFHPLLAAQVGDTVEHVARVCVGRLA